MPQDPLEKNGRLSDKVTRSIFFLGAVLFHLVLFMALASYVIWRTPPPEPDMQAIILPPPPPNVPVPAPVNPVMPVTPAPYTPNVIVDAKSGGQFTPYTPKIADIFNKSDPVPHAPPAPPRNPNPGTPPDPRLPAINHTVFDLWHISPDDLASGNIKCTFPVYVASYADGDWSSSSHLDKDGNIVAGSIPNLLAKVSEWSHGDLKGELVPKPLNIASPELIARMPPFIFFTGHKDFVLTQQEVDNLRQYLHDGGLIWGDNALAGGGSRFDVAFRREMKRVVSDKDLNFVSYTIEDPIFANGRFPLTKFPTGMNFYDEPPQHLDIGGILAILYTPNDYSDMMFMRINPGDASFFMTYHRIPPGTLFTNTTFVEKQSTFYRNFDLKSSLAVHHMGMDIMNYMFLRFRDKLMLPP